MNGFEAFLARGAALSRRGAVRMRQEGRLRTGTHSRRWLAFTAEHIAQVDAAGFSWKARVRLAPLLHLRVQDELRDGCGSGEVSLLGLALARDAGTLEMHSGALHRYLAEAVWYPAALQPSHSLQWNPAGPHAAVATLRDHHIEVALEFRFAANGDVESIHTPARWGKFGKGYRQAPWEGRFGDYAEMAGVRVPREAEVGWLDEGRPEPVWRGRMLEFTRLP